jgi:exopolyphosphatase/guanosine-5'-triphosphate,3'-diphosphate pyrophosphatase
MCPARKDAPVASIDLGSNTVRLLVADEAAGRLKRQLILQETTRLGQGLQPGRPFLPQAADRTWQLLTSYRDRLSALGVGHVLLGATMAVRQASDGRAFLDRVAGELGFDTVILSGHQEAFLTAAGVLTALEPQPDVAVIFDLGGRSTEFCLAVQGRLQIAASLELGAVALTEQHLASDPPTLRELEACRLEIAAVLGRGLMEFQRELKRTGPARTLVGTAGTTTTLAAMAQEMVFYKPELIDNFRLERSTLTGLLDRMAAASVSTRALMPGLPRDRADIIVAGAVVVLETMHFFDVDNIIVSDAGLLEGLWLTAAGRLTLNEGVTAL